MVSTPRTTAPAPRSEPHHRNYQEVYHDLRNRATRNRRSRLTVPGATTHVTGSDIESVDTPATPAYSHMTLDINHYRIVDEVWHFASIDWGHRCKLPSPPRFPLRLTSLQSPASVSTPCTRCATSLLWMQRCLRAISQLGSESGHGSLYVTTVSTREKQ
jgi:hypothetical protein